MKKQICQPLNLTPVPCQNTRPEGKRWCDVCDAALAVWTAEQLKNPKPLTDAQLERAWREHND